MTSRLVGTTTKEGVKEILSQAVDKPWSALKPLSVDVTHPTTLGLVVAGWDLYDVQTACAILSSLLVAKTSDLKKDEGPLKELLHVAATSRHAWIVYLSKALKDLPTQQTIDVNVDLEIFKTSLLNASENLSISASKISQENATKVLPFHSKTTAEEASQSRIQEIQNGIAPARPSAPMFFNTAKAMSITRNNAMAGSLPRGMAPVASLSRGNAPIISRNDTPAASSGKGMFTMGQRAPAVAAQKSLFIQPSKGRPGLTELSIKSPELTSKPLVSPSIQGSAGSSNRPISEGTSKLSPSMSVTSPNLGSFSSSSRTAYQHPSKVRTMSIEAGANVAQQKSQEAARVKQQQEEAKMREKERKRTAVEETRAAKEAKKREREQVKQEKEEIKRRKKELENNKPSRERKMKELEQEQATRDQEREKDRSRKHPQPSPTFETGHGQLVNLSDLRALKRQRKDGEKESPEMVDSKNTGPEVDDGVKEEPLNMEAETVDPAKDRSASGRNSSANLEQVMQSATHLSQEDRDFLMQLYNNTLPASERVGSRQFLYSEVLDSDEQGQSVLLERIFLKVDLVNKTWMLVKRRPKRRV